MRANRLDISLHSAGQAGQHFVVFLCRPACRKSRQRRLNRCHDDLERVRLSSREIESEGKDVKINVVPARKFILCPAAQRATNQRQQCGSSSPFIFRRRRRRRPLQPTNERLLFSQITVLSSGLQYILDQIKSYRNQSLGPRDLPAIEIKQLLNRIECPATNSHRLESRSIFKPPL